MLFHFFILLICYTGIVASQIIYRLYQFNEDQKRQIITIHNRLRALEPASNMQELVWDQRLANLAYGHASRCAAWHRSAYERQGHGYSYIGENIWWSAENQLRFDLQSAMVDFYNEKSYYDYNSNQCMIGAQCGHYTQYVWGETCAVGCAAVHCNGISNGRGINQGHIIICNYGEGGNHYGKRPFLRGPRCSNCRCGNGCTSEGLCPPCCFGTRYSWQQTFIPELDLKLQQSFESKLWQYEFNVEPRRINYQQIKYVCEKVSECQDLEPYCEYWAQYIGCYNKYQDFMMKRCPKTCNFCHPFYSVISQVSRCIDTDASCNFWAQQGECYGPQAAYMMQNCRLSCSLCTSPGYS